MGPSTGVLGVEPTTEAMRRRFVAEFPSGRWIDEVEDAGAGEILYGERLPIRGALDTLRWIHVPYAGVPPEIARFAREREIQLTNSSGINAGSVAEHTLCLMLALARRLPALLERQRSATWSTPVAPLMEDLTGQSVAIIGAGHVGRNVARLCKAFGMRTLACRRVARYAPYIDRLYSRAAVREMVGEARWVVCTAPWTPETDRWVDADVFAAMPMGSRFVNISRGQVVDEDALIAALRSKRLAGAALDVVSQEPLSPDSPLWTMPEVIITPHVASSPIDRSDEAFELFLRNLHRYLSGSALENAVDPTIGY